MKAENVISGLIVLACILFVIAGMETGSKLYKEGQEAGVAVCEVRIERMVRDVDSLTVLVRTLEQEILDE